MMRSSVSRAAVVAAVAATVALAGCSSSGSDDAASTGAGASPAAGTSASTAAPSTTSSEAPSPSSSSESSAPEQAGGAASKSELTATANKLGCKSPVVQSVKKTAPGYKLGVRNVIQCQTGTKEYFLAAASVAQQEKVAQTFVAAGSPGDKMSYVSAPGWMVIGGEVKSQAAPGKKQADEVHDKVGGTVKSVG